MAAPHEMTKDTAMAPVDTTQAATAMAAAAPSKLSAKAIVEKSLSIAAEICVYTNHNFVIEEL